MAHTARARILAGARSLLANGAQPTVAEIAQAAGVSKASFYRSFESRGALLEALSMQPEPAARERILEAALDIIGNHGLSGLSMDDLAHAAGVSRANLYRLFSGKAPLFSSLIRAYSPMEAVSGIVMTMNDQPPEIVMPEIARTVYRAVYSGGVSRVGMLRAMLFEVSSLSPDAEAAARDVFGTIFGSVGVYLVQQMETGRLRRMSPILALQSFIGPIFFHMFTRQLAERLLGLDIDGEQAVTELAEGWLRAMRPQTQEEDALE